MVQLRIKKITRDFVLVIVWCAVIFALSSLHGSGSDRPMVWWQILERKVAHIAEFSVLTWLLWRFVRNFFQDIRTILFFSGFLAFVYALSDEFHQLFVFGREGKLSDVGVDLIGIVGFLLFAYFRKRKMLLKQFS